MRRLIALTSAESRRTRLTGSYWATVTHHPNFNPPHYILTFKCGTFIARAASTWSPNDAWYVRLWRHITRTRS